MKYKIALRKSEEGYNVSVPGLPGCWSQGARRKRQSGVFGMPFRLISPRAASFWRGP